GPATAVVVNPSRAQSMQTSAELATGDGGHVSPAEVPIRTAAATQSADASSRPTPTASSSAEPSHERPSETSKSGSTPEEGIYTDAGLKDFVSSYALECEDKRPDGGALWVYGDAP